MRTVVRKAEILDGDELEIDALPFVPELVTELRQLAAKRKARRFREIPTDVGSIAWCAASARCDHIERQSGERSPVCVTEP